MLIEVPYKEGDVVSIKLSSGEELMGRLDKESNGKLVLEKPLMLTATPEGLGLAPFMFTVSPESKLTINESVIICIHKSDATYSSQYLQSTTGIAV